jgi:hypothetical protein
LPSNVDVLLRAGSVTSALAPGRKMTLGVRDGLGGVQQAYDLLGEQHIGYGPLGKAS